MKDKTILFLIIINLIFLDNFLKISIFSKYFSVSGIRHFYNSGWSCKFKKNKFTCSVDCKTEVTSKAQITCSTKNDGNWELKKTGTLDQCGKGELPGPILLPGPCDVLGLRPNLVLRYWPFGLV